MYIYIYVYIYIHTHTSIRSILRGMYDHFVFVQRIWCRYSGVLHKWLCGRVDPEDAAADQLFRFLSNLYRWIQLGFNRVIHRCGEKENLDSFTLLKKISCRTAGKFFSGYNVTCILHTLWRPFFRTDPYSLNSELGIFLRLSL